MLKFVFFTLFLITSSFSVMAESEPLSNSVSEIMHDIDTSAEVEHVAGHSEKKAGLPQFDITTFASQLFWLLIMSVVLYVFFAKKALPSLSKVITDRRNVIQADLEMADKISIDVEKIREEYETAMQDAQNNSRDVIQNMEAEIRSIAEEKSNEFKNHSAKEVENLEKRANDAKNAVMADLEQTINDLTGQIVKQLSNMDIKQDDIQKIVNARLNAPTKEKQKKAA